MSIAQPPQKEKCNHHPITLECDSCVSACAVSAASFRNCASYAQKGYNAMTTACFVLKERDSISPYFY
jgi:ferredoxin